MYKFIRNTLFLFDPEKVHYFTMNSLRLILKIPGVKFIWKKYYCIQNVKLETKVFGLTFKNPVGLAAGFDKDASMFNDLAYCGFGFIEIGTITPNSSP
jgi:dihydroorotate dehydrogenase